jgi:hypothetical protein
MQQKMQQKTEIYGSAAIRSGAIKNKNALLINTTDND